MNHKIILSMCTTAVGARGAAAIVEIDQVVDISLSVYVTGRYAEIDVANRLAVADRKSTGIVSGREHCGTDSRAQYCKFYWIFHRFIWLLQYQKATGVPIGELLLMKCSNTLFTNELAG